MEIIVQCQDDTMILDDSYYHALRNNDFFNEFYASAGGATLNLETSSDVFKAILNFIIRNETPMVDLSDNKYFQYLIDILEYADYFMVGTLVEKIKELFQGVLFLLCKNNKLDMAKLLYSCGNENTKLDIHYESDVTLAICCKLGYLDLVQWLYSLDDFSPETNRLVFKSSCINNRLDVAKWLWSHVSFCQEDNDLVDPNDVSKDWVDWTFSQVCSRGYLEMAMWLHQEVFHSSEFEEPFCLSCINGQLDVAKWLQSLGADIHVNGEKPFWQSCQYGRLEIAKWLYAVSKKSFLNKDHHEIDYSTDSDNSTYHPSDSDSDSDIDTAIDIHCHTNRAFRLCCENGHLLVAKWLYSLNDNHNDASCMVHACEDEALYQSCRQNHLDVAQWLVSIHQAEQINITINDRIFNDSCKLGRLVMTKWLHSLGADIRPSHITTACANGHLELAKWLYSQHQIDSHLLERAFIRCCGRGYLEIAMWLQSLGVDIHSYNDHAFREACQFGHLEMAKWLFSLNHDPIGLIHMQDEYAFRNTCRAGHLEIAKWLYAEVTSHGDTIDIQIFENDAFVQSCCNGHLETAKWLYSLISEQPDLIRHTFDQCCRNIRISKGPNGVVDVIDMAKWLYSLDNSVISELDSFMNACMTDNLDLVKWFYLTSNGNLDIHARDEFLFRRCCEQHLLAISKWLWSETQLHDQINIHIFDDLVFRNSCKDGNLDMAKWLYSLGGVNIHALNEYAFRMSCESGKIEVAKWLYSLGGVDIHAQDEYAFRMCFRSGYRYLAEWLYSLGGIDIHACNEHAFRLCCAWGELDLIQWLYSLENQSETGLILDEINRIDIHAENDEAFHQCCEDENITVIHWLYSLDNDRFEPLIRQNLDILFRSCIRYGELEMAKWLYSFGGINIRSLDFTRTNHAPTLDWLLSLANQSE